MLKPASKTTYTPPVFDTTWEDLNSHLNQTAYYNSVYEDPAALPFVPPPIPFIGLTTGLGTFHFLLTSSSSLVSAATLQRPPLLTLQEAHERLRTDLLELSIYSGDYFSYF